MSFDLYFCWQKNERIDFESVVTWAQTVGNFRGGSDQLWYQNEGTGVYFSLDFEAEAPEDPEDARVPPGACDTGLSFNLNFIRPSFFAFEAMPIVAELARRFGLSVFDPQADNAKSLQQSVDAKNLVDSWSASNQWAVHAFVEQPGASVVRYMPPAKSLYLWKYAREKKRLEEGCGEDVFVPTLSPVCRQGTTDVDTAVICTEGIPMIMPASDWVIVVRDKKGLFRSKKDKDVGVISREAFNALVGSHLRDFDWEDDMVVQIIQPDSAEPVAKILSSIDRTLERDEFEVLARDSFVDVEPPVTSESHSST